jgi:hypothetical protein
MVRESFLPSLWENFCYLMVRESFLSSLVGKVLLSGGTKELPVFTVEKTKRESGKRKLYVIIGED